MLCALFHFLHFIVVNTPGELNNSSGDLFSADNPWQTHIRPDTTSDLILDNNDGYKIFANFNSEKKMSRRGYFAIANMVDSGVRKTVTGDSFINHYRRHNVRQ